MGALTLGAAAPDKGPFIGRENGQAIGLTGDSGNDTEGIQSDSEHGKLVGTAILQVAVAR